MTLRLIRTIESARLAARDAELQRRARPLISHATIEAAQFMLDNARANAANTPLALDYLRRARDILDGEIETVERMAEREGR